MLKKCCYSHVIISLFATLWDILITIVKKLLVEKIGLKLKLKRVKMDWFSRCQLVDRQFLVLKRKKPNIDAWIYKIVYLHLQIF